tara:strand:+ start:14 stop:1990 length:1977 start_codon:yes stop_codon:yes gene_type:complete
MSDPKNKWTRPQTPPAPMFFGEKERNLVKQVNDELAERVLGQTIAYYPISIEESNFNDVYGEAKEKVSLPPVRVFAYVDVQNEQTNTKFGYEYQTKLTVNFHRRRLVEDQNLFVRVGDFVQYGDVFYEIVKTYNDTRFYFGQVEHKFQISAECVRARDGAFRIVPGIDRPTLQQQEESDVSSPAPRPVPYPPLEATYITLNSEIKLPNERRLAAGTGIEFVDAGPNSTLTISATGEAADGIVGAVQLQSGSGAFTGDSNLVFLTGSGRLGVNTFTPDVTLEIGTSSVDTSPAIRFTGLRPRIQFFETDQTTQYQIQSSNGMLKFQTQNNDFDSATVRWQMNSSGNMAFRDGAAGEPIPARIYISGSGNQNLLQVSSSAAADILVVTGSGKVGVRTSNPSHELTVVGGLSASANSFFGGDVSIAGTLIGGSPLKIAGAIEIHDISNGGGVVASLGDVSEDGTTTMSASAGQFANVTSTTLISASAMTATTSLWHNLTCSSFVSASLYFGDGRHLTNVTASAITTGDGPVGALQFRVDNPISNEISGTTKVSYNVANNRLTVNGGLAHNRVSVATSYTASAGNYIIGVSAVPTNILFNATDFSAGQTLVVKDESGQASSATSVILNPAGSQTIDGAPAIYLESPYGSVFLYTDGSDWFIY